MRSVYLFATILAASSASAEMLTFDCTPNGMDAPLLLEVDTDAGTAELTGNDFFADEFLIIQVSRQAIWLRQAAEDDYVLAVTAIRRGQGGAWSKTQIDDTASTMANLVGTCDETS